MAEEQRERTKKGDFVEIIFTGKANGKLFDSNIKEDLKKINPEAEPKKTIVVIGENMVVPGLDKALEDKETDKKYAVKVSPKEGFGERIRELVKTIPLSVFTHQKINPIPGQSLLMDNSLVKIITVSGARVVTDFNSPLAGKELEYEFTIKRKIHEDKEKAEALFDFFFRIVPKFETNQDSIVVELPKQAEPLIKIFSDKFKKLLGKDLKFKELKENNAEEKDLKPLNEDKQTAD